MYAVEFQTPIENDVVHTPQQYQEIHNTNDKKHIKENNVIDELDELFANSNNKVQVTMELATNIDEMLDDGILFLTPNAPA